MSNYREILQNPRVAFKSSELQNGDIKTSPLGLPSLVSGGFALTACLTTKHNGNKLAIRCFHKEVPDLQERYQYISDFLRKQTDKFFVTFEYQREGIHFQGNWYPIVKMDWIEGVSLNEYVEDNLDKPHYLEALANKLKQMSNRLELLKMSHGDLQHGNILIRNHDPMLIDYDGTYVPGMPYSKSNEIGHINFQHPSRNNQFFNEKIDYFASIVLYVSILSIRFSGKRIWQEYHTGENLIFSRKDYQDPDNSKIFSTLKTVTEVSQLIEKFQYLCSCDIKNIPSLTQFLNSSISLPKKISQPSLPRNQNLQYNIYPSFHTSNLKEIIRQDGNIVTITGKVLKASTHNGMCFINFGEPWEGCILEEKEYNPFTIVAFAKNIEKVKQIKFWDFYDNPGFIKGKYIEITGLLGLYPNKKKGYLVPQIIWDEPYQLNIITSKNLITNTSSATSTSTLPVKPKPPKSPDNIWNDPFSSPVTSITPKPSVPNKKPKPPSPQNVQPSPQKIPQPSNLPPVYSNTPTQQTSSHQGQKTTVPETNSSTNLPQSSEDNTNGINGVGTTVGAAVGAVVAGPPGALIGAIGGAMIGKWFKSWSKEKK